MKVIGNKYVILDPGFWMFLDRTAGALRGYPVSIIKHPASFRHPLAYFFPECMDKQI
jgi:hypothetical protein